MNMDIRVILSIYKIPSYRIVSKIEYMEWRLFFIFQAKYSKGIYLCLAGSLDDPYRLFNIGYILSSGKIKWNTKSLDVVIYDVKLNKFIKKNDSNFLEIYKLHYKEFFNNNSFFNEFKD